MTVWFIYSPRLFLFHFRRERDIEIPQPTDAVGGRYWTLTTNFGIFFSCSQIGKTMSLLKFVLQGEMKPLTSKSPHRWLEKPQIYTKKLIETAAWFKNTLCCEIKSKQKMRYWPYRPRGSGRWGLPTSSFHQQTYCLQSQSRVINNFVLWGRKPWWVKSSNKFTTRWP